MVFLTACGEDDETTTPEVEPDENQISFSKSNGADPTLEANQDRITDNVWITRGNNGGQIFNIKINSTFSKSESPEDTEWAIGTVDNKDNLTFQPFRAAVGEPKDVVGKDLVMHLITDDIYLNVRFSSWTQAQGGGFAYVRDIVE